MKRARKLAAKQGITEATAFEKVYTDPANADLVAMDKADGSVGAGSDFYGTGSRPTEAASMPIETSRSQPAEADGDADDVTPASAYERLLAMAEDYAAKNDVSVAVAFVQISQDNPELFATSKMPTALAVSKSWAIQKSLLAPSMDDDTDVTDPRTPYPDALAAAGGRYIDKPKKGKKKGKKVTQAMLSDNR